MQEIFFKNRTDAGRQLASNLKKYKNSKEAVVYGLPRGGIAVAKEISKSLNLPLDVLQVRKIGHQYNPEFAIAAITESGPLAENNFEKGETDPAWLSIQIDRQRALMKERDKAYYTGGKKPVSPEGRVAIIVDDGAATGLTMLAAIREAWAKKAKKIVVALPVASKDVAVKLREEAAEVVVIDEPDYYLGSVGAYYDDFSEVDDQAVIELLKDPLIFYQPDFHRFAETLAGLPGNNYGRYLTDRFRNQEMQVIIESDVEAAACYVIGTLAPPETNLLEIGLLADTLKKEGAERVTGIFPYLSYMRQDKEEMGKSLAGRWLADFLAISGFDEIFTFDIHSPFDLEFFEIPIYSKSPARLFAEELDKRNLANTTLIAPDEGALHRCDELNKALRMNVPVAYFHKERHGDEIHSVLHGEIGPKAIIIDDILDTGVTMISACNVLKERGVTDIVVMVTHGLFSGTLWEDLWELNVSEIFTTDTIPQGERLKEKGISVLSVRSLLREHFGGTE